MTLNDDAESSSKKDENSELPSSESSVSSQIERWSDRIKQLERLGYEREHRPVVIWLNLLRHYKDPDKNWAVVTACLHWIFRSAGIAAIVGSSVLVGYGSLYLMWSNNALVKEQVVSADRQTRLLAQQTELLKNQIELSAVQNTLADSARKAGIQQEVFSLLRDVEQYVSQNGGNKNTILSESLRARVLSLLQISKPYRYYDGRNSLIPKPLSPERSMLVMGIVAANGNVDFIDRRGALQDADFSNLEISRLFSDPTSTAEWNALALLKQSEFLKGASFKGASLQMVQQIHLDLGDACFDGSTLKYVSFGNSDLSRCSFRNCVFEECVFWQSTLPPAYAFAGSVFKNSRQLYGARSIEADFIENLVKANVRIGTESVVTVAGLSVVQRLSEPEAIILQQGERVFEFKGAVPISVIAPEGDSSHYNAMAEAARHGLEAVSFWKNVAAARIKAEVLHQ